MPNFLQKLKNIIFVIEARDSTFGLREGMNTSLNATKHLVIYESNLNIFIR